MGKSLRGAVFLVCAVLVIPACDTSPNGTDPVPAPPIGLNEPPTSRIVTPVSGSILQNGVAVDFNVAAADPDGAVAAVAIFEGSNRLTTLLTEPFDFTWVPVVDGTFSLTAVATDTSGASTTSDPVSVIVQTPGRTPDPPNRPPVIFITNPADGAIFTEGSSITLSSDATDPDGPTLVVEYFDGATSIGTATLIPFVFNWSGATRGTHSIRAVATDGLGASTSSAPVTITIIAPTSTTSSQNGRR
jgi:chitinase